ncbi:hypothetical protein Tco_1487591, partial [Tanacetum coccineum]
MPKKLVHDYSIHCIHQGRCPRITYPVEETVFMAIEEDDESDNEQEEEDNKSSHYAFMFHPGPPTKIAEMVQSVGSWKPNTIKIESSLFSSSFRNPFLFRMALTASFAAESSRSWAIDLHASDLSILIG